jgi:hypothetical protein
MLSNKYIKNKTIKIWGATLCPLTFMPDPTLKFHNIFIAPY